MLAGTIIYSTASTCYSERIEQIGFFVRNDPTRLGKVDKTRTNYDEDFGFEPEPTSEKFLSKKVSPFGLFSFLTRTRLVVKCLCTEVPPPPSGGS